MKEMPTLNNFCDEIGIGAAAFDQYYQAVARVTEEIHQANAALEAELKKIQASGIPQAQVNGLKFLAQELLEGVCRASRRGVVPAEVKTEAKAPAEESQLVLLEVAPQEAPFLPAGFYTGRPRPTLSAKEVLIAVANKLLSQVMDWGSYTAAEESEVGEQILKALEYAGHDGYDLTKYLDDHFHWSVDAELTDIMGCADYYGCHREAVKCWIRDTGAKPALVVGQEVTVKNPRDGDTTGFIRDITDDGMYCVRIPSKGHVEEGLGTHGSLYPWEDLERWQA